MPHIKSRHFCPAHSYPCLIIPLLFSVLLPSPDSPWYPPIHLYAALWSVKAPLTYIINSCEMSAAPELRNKSIAQTPPLFTRPEHNTRKRSPDDTAHESEKRISASWKAEGRLDYNFAHIDLLLARKYIEEEDFIHESLPFALIPSPIVLGRR